MATASVALAAAKTRAAQRREVAQAPAVATLGAIPR